MNWQSISILVVVLVALAVVIVRSERRVRRWLILLLPPPLAVLLYRWAAYRQSWNELGLAGLIAIILFVAWWLAIGRRLPPPQGSSIRVWTKDDPP